MLARRVLLLSFAGVPLFVLPVAGAAQVRVVPERRTEEINAVRQQFEVLRKALEANEMRRQSALESLVQAQALARAEIDEASVQAVLTAQQGLRARVVAAYPSGFDEEPGLTRRVQWYQDDPADSLFRLAHGLFTEQQYRGAAEHYAQLRSRYPDSRYFCDAAYYEAFARYRLGTPDELSAANGVLETTAARCSSGERSVDVPELRARIDGALARLGDANAVQRLRQAAGAGQDVCDREESRVKVAALSALAEMDPAAADPVLEGVLATRDECSAPVRERAVSIVARRDDAGAITMLIGVARSDVDRGTRREAVRALGRMSNAAAAYAALEELLRSSGDEGVQAEAARALARSDHPGAEAAVRGLIERADVAENIRISAIDGLARRDPPPSLESWASMYANAGSDELRAAVIEAASRAHEEGAHPFLLEIARDQSASPAVREAAVSRVRSSAPIPELYALYEMAGSRSIRISIVGGLARREEPEATDRLIEIAKASTDPEVRAAAIRALGRSAHRDDPRVIRALTEILACCEF